MHQDKPGIEQRLLDRIGNRDWLRFFWYDDPTQEISRKELEEAATFIEKHVRGGRRRRVLIHCWAGHSRSVSIVLFYLMNKTRDFKTVDAALQFIQEKRPTINPNLGFLAQLRKHNKEKE
jgi:protein-tyrosine phosphatase